MTTQVWGEHSSNQLLSNLFRKNLLQWFGAFLLEKLYPIEIPYSVKIKNKKHGVLPEEVHHIKT